MFRAIYNLFSKFVTTINVAVFVRVSKASQDYERQIADLSAYAERNGYKVARVIAEKVSGAKRNAERAGVSELLELSRTGKIKKVLVTEVSRLGRNTGEVLSVIEKLKEEGVSVFALNYNLETLAPDGKPNPLAQLLFTILAEFARLERETLIERIHSGLDQAKRNGKTLGRPKGTVTDKAALLKKYPTVVRFVRQGFSFRQAAKLAGVSVNTVRKIQKLLEEP